MYALAQSFATSVWFHVCVPVPVVIFHWVCKFIDVPAVPVLAVTFTAVPHEPFVVSESAVGLTFVSAANAAITASPDVIDPVVTVGFAVPPVAPPAVRYFTNSVEAADTFQTYMPFEVVFGEKFTVSVSPFANPVVATAV